MHTLIYCSPAESQESRATVLLFSLGLLLRPAADLVPKATYGCVVLTEATETISAFERKTLVFCWTSIV